MQSGLAALTKQSDIESVSDGPSGNYEWLTWHILFDLQPLAFLYNESWGKELLNGLLHNTMELKDISGKVWVGLPIRPLRQDGIINPWLQAPGTF